MLNMNIKKFNIIDKIKIQSERVLLEAWIRLILAIYFLANLFIIYPNQISVYIFRDIFQILIQIYPIWFLKHSKTASLRLIKFWVLLWVIFLSYIQLPSLINHAKFSWFSFIVLLTYIDMLIYLYKFNKKLKSDKN